MKRDTNRLFLLMAIAVALVSFDPPGAAAQDSDADAAKEHYEQGWKALQNEEYEVALAHYQRSYELAPRPRTLFNIAVAEEMLGRIDEALQHYADFLDIAEERDKEFKDEAENKIDKLYELRAKARHDEPVPPVDDSSADAPPSHDPCEAWSPPPSYEQPPSDGQGVLWIHSNIAGATVSIDGMVVGSTAATSSANGGAELRHQLAPGAHDVMVERSGARAWHERTHISPGETVAVDVAFHDTHVSRTKALTWGLAGVGVVSVAAGGTLGVLALRDVTSSTADDHDRGKSRALVTDLLIAGGAVAIYGAWRLSKHPKTTATVHRTHEAE